MMLRALDGLNAESSARTHIPKKKAEPKAKLCPKVKAKAKASAAPAEAEEQDDEGEGDDIPAPKKSKGNGKGKQQVLKRKTGKQN